MSGYDFGTCSLCDLFQIQEEVAAEIRVRVVKVYKEKNLYKEWVICPEPYDNNLLAGNRKRAAEDAILNRLNGGETSENDTKDALEDVLNFAGK